MGQLTVKEILAQIIDLERRYGKAALDIPVYIGDDDELNGIHCAWYVQEVKDDGAVDNQLTIELINENSNNLKFKDKALLIS